MRGQSFDSPSGAHRWYGPSVSVSNDGGRTFSGPTVLELNNLDNAPQDATILADGGLAILYVDFQQPLRGWRERSLLTNELDALEHQLRSMLEGTLATS